MTLTPWKPWNPVPNAEAIASTLKDFPSNWSLTPLRGKKPYRKGWQTEPPLLRETIARLILDGEKAINNDTGETYTGFASGFGLRLGDVSDGLLAIDLDGESAKLILEAMGCGNISPTVIWTSGKPGRCQVLYRVPDSIRPNLKDFTSTSILEWQ
jgi:hypothetical protein